MGVVVGAATFETEDLPKTRRLGSLARKEKRRKKRTGNLLLHQAVGERFVSRVLHVFLVCDEESGGGLGQLNWIACFYRGTTEITVATAESCEGVRCAEGSVRISWEQSRSCGGPRGKFPALPDGLSYTVLHTTTRT